MTSAIMQLPQSEIQRINSAVDQYNTLVHFVKRSLRDGLDFGKIKGCGEKPILFKPGAEKIATLFRLRESLERLEAVKDWTGQTFGEPFFNFEYKCTLKDCNGDVVAECVGSCNSWEEKYRYRQAQRVCPSCGAVAIKRSGYEDRQTGDKGWYCHTKSGGCNAKFHSADPAIIGQEQGKVPNERVFDQVNTIDKMAQKRAFVGAVILAANASNFFAVEHSELETIDADFEPKESIAEAQSMRRISVEVIEDVDPAQQNRDRIQAIIKHTGHTLQEVRKVAGKGAEAMSPSEMDLLIDTLLIDLAQTRHVPPLLSRRLLSEIRSEQPQITDDNLRLRLLDRCDTALSEQVPSRPQSEYVGAVSIS